MPPLPADLISTTMLPPDDIWEFGFSNFDRSVAPGTEQYLRDNARERFVTYAGWDFFALVAFDGEKFLVEVQRYKKSLEVIEVENFEDIMDTVSERWGWE